MKKVDISDELYKELKNELKDISDIIGSVRMSLNIVSHLDNIEPNYKIIITRNEFFWFTYTTQFRLAILELSKLFSTSRNDYYSFNNFIKRLSKDGKYGGAISEGDIEKLMNILKEYKSITNDLVTFRNKSIAHTDKKVEQRVNIRGISEVCSIQKLAEYIINYIADIINGTFFLFSRLDYIVFDLDDALKHRKDMIDTYTKLEEGLNN